MPVSLLGWQLCTSLRRSRNGSAFSTASSGRNEKILPSSVVTKRRLVPGADDMCVSFWKLSLGKTRSRRYGNGGSGLPWTFEVVQGTRVSPAGACSCGGSASTEEKSKLGRT